MKKLINTVTRHIGNHHETVARKHCEAQGLLFLCNNFYARGGEIDLIMLDQDTLVFLEVRYRSNDRHGGAMDSITANKCKKIIKTAKFFLTKNPQYAQHSCRFDVIAIDKIHAQLHINWVKNAFME